MREKPTAAQLLELAREVLRAELIPLLPADKRYDALMIANAMAIAMREGDAPLGMDDAQMAELADAIRNGDYDGDDGMFQQLMDETTNRVRISNPKYLHHD